MVRVRRLTRTGMIRLARDETATAGSGSALVLAPHPDDETLGCGATILRKVDAGTRVTIAVLTDGRHSHQVAALSPNELACIRRAEMVEAARRLGLGEDALRWGNLVDGTLRDHEDSVVDVVAALIRELAPKEIYATCAAEPHPDHAAVGRAARRAVRATGSSARLLEYPVWLWESWPVCRGDRLGSTADALGRLLRRRVTKVRAGRHIVGKLYALRAHGSQLRRPGRVPAGTAWPVLPAGVLAAAADPVELFLP